METKSKVFVHLQSICLLKLFRKEIYVFLLYFIFWKRKTISVQNFQTFITNVNV